MQNKGCIPALLGPTAVGKTEISIALAKAWDGEIVSADSIQVYTGLNIGSAKPTEAEQQGIPHHLMDVIPPDCHDFSVAAYQRRAYEAFGDIIARGKRPFVVGGTGLYIMALEQGLRFGETPGDPALRAHWQEREGLEPGSAHRALGEIDPQSAGRLHPNDIKRIIRALEIVTGSGLTMAEHTARQAEAEKPYTLVKAALTMPRELLYERIEERVGAMIDGGLVEEVRSLLASGVPPSRNALQGLGYKEIVAYLQGALTLTEAAEAIKLGTRHFAKRQWTWFRRDKEIRWFDVTDFADREALLQALLAYYDGEA